jgi:hypothetical protein
MINVKNIEYIESGRPSVTVDRGLTKLSLMIYGVSNIGQYLGT